MMQGQLLQAWGQLTFPGLADLAAQRTWFGWVAGTEGRVDVPCAWTGVVCANGLLSIRLQNLNLTGACPSLVRLMWPLQAPHSCSGCTGLAWKLHAQRCCYGPVHPTGCHAADVKQQHLPAWPVVDLGALCMQAPSPRPGTRWGLIYPACLWTETPSRASCLPAWAPAGATWRPSPWPTAACSPASLRSGGRTAPSPSCRTSRSRSTPSSTVGGCAAGLLDVVMLAGDGGHLVCPRTHPRSVCKHPAVMAPLASTCDHPHRPQQACCAGTLPDLGSGGSLQSLTGVYARNTGLTGTLPATWSLPALRWLDLSTRQRPDWTCQPGGGLTGKAAAAAAACDAMAVTRVPAQGLAGAAVQAGCMGGVQSACLSTWLMSGQCPHARRPSHKLSRSEHATGSIPDAWGTMLPMLGTLRLSCNQLVGPLPASLISAKSFGPSRMFVLHINANQVCHSPPLLAAVCISLFLN